MRSALVRVRETTHARHDTENVVVRRVDVDVGGGLLLRSIGELARVRSRLIGRQGVETERHNVREERLRRERQVEHGVVNAGEVARAAGLEVLRLEGEGVDVDTRGRCVAVVLVRLDEVEVAALTLRETVLAVELDLGDGHGVAELRVAVAPRGVGEREAVVVAGVLDDPDELLTGVVEGELDLVGGGCDRLRARELELLNQVLVRDLGEAAALLRVQVDVVHVEGAGDQALVGDVVEDVEAVGASRDARLLDVTQVLELVELNVDLHLVVLERNQREREASVAVEPELQRNVESLLRDTVVDRYGVDRTIGDGGVTEGAVITHGLDVGVVAGQCLGIVGVNLRHAGAAGLAGTRQGHATIAVHHVEVSQLLANGESELIPDVEPLTIVLVNLLATDLHVHVINHVLAEVGDPGEGARVHVGAKDGAVNRGERHLDVDTRDQIAVTGDRALHTLAEVADTVEGLLNGLHREVGVTTIELLEEGNLRVSRKVNVLSAVGDELHQTTGCHCLYFTNLNYFGRIGGVGRFGKIREILKIRETRGSENPRIQRLQ